MLQHVREESVLTLRLALLVREGHIASWGGMTSDPDEDATV